LGLAQLSITPDRSHDAAIGVTKGLRRLAIQLGDNLPRGVLALLNGYGR